MKNWLTVKEAASVLKMSEQGLYSAVREQQLPEAAVLRIGRRIRIDPTALRTSRDMETGRDQSEKRDAA